VAISHSWLSQYKKERSPRFARDDKFTGWVHMPPAGKRTKGLHFPN